MIFFSLLLPDSSNAKLYQANAYAHHNLKDFYHNPNHTNLYSHMNSAMNVISLLLLPAALSSNPNKAVDSFANSFKDSNINGFYRSSLTNLLILHLQQLNGYKDYISDIRKQAHMNTIMPPF